MNLVGGVLSNPNLMSSVILADVKLLDSRMCLQIPSCLASPGLW